MDTPLYKLYLFKYTPQFYQVPVAEIRAVRAKMAEKQAALGIRDLFNAEMSWSNEKWEFFGVEFYPNLEAVQSYARCLKETGFLQYINSESYLGIPMDSSFPDFTAEPEEEQPAQFYDAQYGESSGENPPKPVYRVYLSRRAQTAELIPPNERAQILERTQETARLAGIKPLLSAYVRWNSESWDYFGIERFPSMETLIRYSQFLTEIGWYRLTDSQSYLGTAFGGLVVGIT
jgi:hypothetical protein